MGLRIYLLRHGETDFNKKGLEGGQPSRTPLNKLGIIQSKKLAKRLGKIHFDKIFSSKLKRAIQTANEIKKVSKSDIVFDERLNEYRPGEVDPSSEKWMNKYDEILKSGVSKYEIRPFGGENIWDLIKRVSSFLKDLEKEKGTVAIIGHSGVNAVLINLSQRKEKNEFYKIKQDNACINILDFSNGKWNIESINESDHLDDLLPKKNIYKNQEEIKEEIKAYLMEKFADISKKIYISGDLITGKFGYYNRPYKRYKGSTIELYVILKANFKIPREWKICLFNKNTRKYEAGDIILENTKHKINLNLIKNLKYLKQIKISGEKVEEII